MLLFTASVGMMAGLVAVTLKGCVDSIEPVTTSHYSEQELKYVEIFKSWNSPKPYEMAIAVCKTKSPKLMTAIAVRESNGNPDQLGDGGKAKGAFQVQEQYWGDVPDTATEQAQQAEEILETLVRKHRGSLRRALAHYNGGYSNSRESREYALKVIKIRKEIKL